MQFRDLKRQYQKLKQEIDSAIFQVCTDSNYISGNQVIELEKQLAEYVGVKHCITCANGTDALTLALMALGIGSGDAVFVPNFTFFATAEAPAFLGAQPVFVDVSPDTYNISSVSLEDAIKIIISQGRLVPKCVIPVDLFGLPADYSKIRAICNKYGIYVLEDAAQGFGGSIANKLACSFGDISATSFFPAKPLGCYGDGGAVFTDNDDFAEYIKSISVHGKGKSKYDNVRIGMNSRLDTIQAAILQIKLNAFKDYELEAVQNAAAIYNGLLSKNIKLPIIPNGYTSSYAQYTIQLNNIKQRNDLQNTLRQNNIPSMVYYPKPLSKQSAFDNNSKILDLSVTEHLCNSVLSLPIHPYITKDEVYTICQCINRFLEL